ncbi:isoflavone reductase family protein [Gloeophyllum trabeum ATCC 11539]|uniref:Isoflavone reductase family protein n=1 Tax=Gloeophyllum trabeum (strain ATCC 11539 / FP-39264 / Madison 617) TaxID=670483 RepID=S7S573_GLOTA|nr:isoflavone reductase family protein [Gloeophyllum trabeum ATCC 11539]EPQ61099.1 isoflavone reductase family protein [Gloeophyllum trabeum ATCC 11539]
MSQLSSVLLLGAGELGTAILSGLAKKYTLGSIQLALCLRPQTISDTKKTQRLRDLASPHTLELVSGDLGSDSAAELATKFARFDVVIGCTGYAAGRGTQVKICEAVLKAGVKRYFPWQFGGDYDAIGRGSAQDLFDEQLDVRDMLRAQDKTRWVIISTGMFTSFLFDDSFGLVERKEDGEIVVRGLGSWENRITVTAVEDIGRITAEVAIDESIEGVVYGAGETITCERLAQLVEAAMGKDARVTRELWTLDQLREALRQDPLNPLKKYRVIFAEGKGVSWDIERTINYQRGIDTTDVARWLKLHAIN